MERYQRQSRYTDLQPYCHHSKEGDFMELTEWHNGEGFDLVINSDRIFSITWGQFECLQALVAYKG